MFQGTVTSYRDKVAKDCGEAARGDANGFYHGMAIKHGKDTFILAGPEVKFVPDEEPTRPGMDVQPEGGRCHCFCD
jgi:hypothetical protein